ncbi:MAG: 1-deoxy-D-xylulose-5-phosphate synthase N-terminal domain-containing protein [Rickettsiales bacterium]
MKYIKNQKHLEFLSAPIRSLTIDAVQNAKSGHIGMPLGFADIATVLLFEVLKKGDKIVLSAGHGSMLLYSIYYLLGHKNYSIQELKNFRKINSNTPGHPEFNGVEIIATTGPLAQGLGIAVGLAIATKKDKKNNKIYCIVGDGCLMEGLSYEAISIAGHLNLNNLIILFDSNSISIDGPTNLAVSENQLLKFQSMGWKTHSANGHNLHSIRKAFAKNNLIKSILTDNSIFAKNNIKFLDGINTKLLKNNNTKPYFIEFKTIIGKFTSYHLENSEKIHSGFLNEQDEIFIKKQLNYNNLNKFEVNDKALKIWRNLGLNLLEIDDKILEIDDKVINSQFAQNTVYNKPCAINLNYKISCNKIFIFKLKRYKITSNIKIVNIYLNSQSVIILLVYNKIIFNLNKEVKHFFPNNIKNILQEKIYNNNINNNSNIEIIFENIDKIVNNNLFIPASRKIFKKIVNNALILHSKIIFGSADLSESNCLKPISYNAINKNDFSGNFIHYGAREHAMSAICNGLSICDYIPICGTFFVFSDYMRPSIRLSAMMRLKVIYIMTHDSIGVGEDGPTHHPIEHIASFRNLPNLKIFRPFLVIDLCEAIKFALLYQGPSMILLPRQELLLKDINSLKTLISNDMLKLDRYNLAGYIISGAVQDDICIISTGLDLHIALQVKYLLVNNFNLKQIKIISIPSISLFDQLNQEKQIKLLNAKYIFTIELSSNLSLSFNFIKINKQFCLNEFGKSGSFQDLLNYFNMTTKFIASQISKNINIQYLQ